ncbi:MAG: hypothetical protein SFZ23_04375 [Planctomycetota bacterium]|nr:hypothetical protein [Planctomycetota bacterium]
MNADRVRVEAERTGPLSTNGLLPVDRSATEHGEDVMSRRSVLATLLAGGGLAGGSLMARASEPDGVAGVKSVPVLWQREVTVLEDVETGDILSVLDGPPQRVLATGASRFEAILTRSEPHDGIAVLQQRAQTSPPEAELLLRSGTARFWNGVPRFSTRRHRGTITCIAGGEPQLLLVAAELVRTPNGGDKVTYRLFLLEDATGAVKAINLELNGERRDLTEASYIEWVEDATTCVVEAQAVRKPDYSQLVKDQTQAILDAAERAGAPPAKVGP